MASAPSVIITPLKRRSIKVKLRALLVTILVTIFAIIAISANASTSSIVNKYAGHFTCNTNGGCQGSTSTLTSGASAEWWLVTVDQKTGDGNAPECIDFNTSDDSLGDSGFFGMAGTRNAYDLSGSTQGAITIWAVQIPANDSLTLGVSFENCSTGSDTQKQLAYDITVDNFVGGQPNMGTLSSGAGNASSFNVNGLTSGFRWTAVAHQANESTTVGSGYSALGSATGTNNSSLLTESKGSGTNAGASWATSSAYGYFTLLAS